MQEYFLRQCLTHTSTSRLVAAVIIATIITAIMVMMIMMIFFFFKNSLIYSFLVAKGLHYCPWAFSSCSEQGLFSAFHAQDSHCDGIPFAEQTLEHWLGACGTTGMWDLPGPGIEPVSPALAGRFLITRPPGKSMFFVLLLLLL